MLRLLRRRRSPRPPARPRRVALDFERLETRDCPAAPTVTLTTRELANRMVELSGVVTDEHPATVQLTFSGVASGTAQPGADGRYSVQLPATSLGQVQVVARDDENLSSNPVSAAFTTQGIGITLSVTQGSGQQVTVCGQVTDEFPAGRVVTLSGAVQGTATTDSQGRYSLTTNLSGSGRVTAVAADQWGMGGCITEGLYVFALADSASMASGFLDFTGSESAGGLWTFTGHTDPSNAGDTVGFTGIPSVNGQQTTVQPDGSFSLTVPVAAGEGGNVEATLYDPSGHVIDRIGTSVQQTN
jgi:hypothetical protein